MGCPSYFQAISRRQALKTGVQAGLTGLLPWLMSGSALSQVKLGVSKSQTSNHTLVVLFLRGGADGLNMVVPYQEARYYDARPSIAIAAPQDTRKGSSARSVALNEQFALHPALAPLKKWYEREKLAIAHAVGSGDMSRSHFEAMSAMERGVSHGHSSEPSGWLARYLVQTASELDTPLRAVAWAETVPDSLRGAPSPTIVQSISDFLLSADEGFLRYLKSAYRDGEDLVAKSGRDTLTALEKIEKLDAKNYQPSHGAVYPATELGRGFREVASLLKSDLGLEIASLEETGWDNHAAQGADTGIHANQLKKVAEAVDAFMTDLGELSDKVTLIVMTEFGRRLEENASLGTDHGRASVMMALGAVPGGKIYGKWPGLGEDQVDKVGDLKPVNDYRTMLNFFLESKMPVLPSIWKA